ncbi:MAG: DUF3467 domain-containing protein [Bacteroidaceae bacterium]|nr:DUF3467 domain-containing protein [Bacteroidaceae bacterium]
MSKENFDQNYQLELDEDVVFGNYSNIALISHSSSEFVLDFARMAPGLMKPSVCDRIILAPEHAKRLLLALQDNIAKYEHVYGQIQLAKNQSSKPIAPFDINKGEA